ncbi:NIPSNAP family protein OS=Streptomyces cyaneofuscatus OX=66883 GN=G3I52_31540 PE=4 SV=1 [Streptomyces cyaneofuscatus]
MITIHLKYEIDAEKLDDFEAVRARRWVRLVNRFGRRTHHG